MSEYGDSPVKGEILLGLRLLSSARSVGLDISEMSDPQIARLMYIAKLCVDLDNGKEAAEGEIKDATGVEESELKLLRDNIDSNPQLGEFSLSTVLDRNLVALRVPHNDEAYGLDPDTAADIGLSMADAAITVSEHNDTNLALNVPKNLLVRLSKGFTPVDIKVSDESEVAVIAKDGQIYLQWCGDWVCVAPVTATKLGMALIAQVKRLQKMTARDQLH